MKKTTATAGRIAECPFAPHRRTAQCPGKRLAPGLLPAASLPRTAIAQSKVFAFWKKPFAAACAFGRFSSASRRRRGRKGCCPNSAPRSRLCCCPTNYLPASFPATRPRAWQRWRDGRNFLSKMCWPNPQPDRCWPLPACRTRGIWERSCAQRRLSAPAACCWERARSARLIRKSCGLRRVRCSGCRWREQSWPIAIGLHEKRIGLRLVATASHKGTPLDQANLSGPLAIFIGSEGAGLSRDLIKEMDEVVAIPQAPQVESLNAGVAASIVLYEVTRQRK